MNVPMQHIPRDGADRGKLATRGIWSIIALALWMSLMSCSLGGSGKATKPTHDWAPQAEPLLRQVADQVLKDHPQPIAFDWGEGVLMAGMMQAGVVLQEPRYIDYVRRWADHWHRQGLEPLLAKRGYCGHWGPGLPVMMLYEHTRDPRYFKMTEQIIQFMQARATRTSDGGLGHWRDNRQLWVDTLYMACPVYARYGAAASNRKLLNEGARQLAIFAQNNRDAQTGLFYHMYDDDKKQVVGQLWGRGNGWVAMSYVEVLKRMDRDSESYAARLKEFSRLVDGLRVMQDPATGMWHTVLDRSNTYLETSASAMFLYAMLDAHQSGILKLKDPGVLKKTWQSLAQKVSKAGQVVGVSGGTGPAPISKYVNIPQGTFHWGTGAWLLAASKVGFSGTVTGTVNITCTSPGS